MGDTRRRSGCFGLHCGDAATGTDSTAGHRLARQISFLSEPQSAVFVDGCFWHGCPDHYVRPRTKNEFWDAKLKENVDRDRRQTVELTQLGWRVVRVWEHQVWEELDDTVEAIVVLAVHEVQTAHAVASGPCRGGRSSGGHRDALRPGVAGSGSESRDLAATIYKGVEKEARPRTSVKTSTKPQDVDHVIYEGVYDL